MGDRKDQWETSRTPPLLKNDHLCLTVFQHVGSVPDIHVVSIGLLEPRDKRDT